MTLTDLDSLVSKVRPEMPPDLGVGMADPAEAAEPLYPVEEAAILRAISKRRQEFAAGRRAARAALEDFGLDAQPIPMAEDRAPVWPPGIAGSISHTDHACLAVIAPKRTTRSIGIDLEQDDDLERALWNEVCSQRERALLGQPDGRAARRLFSAKEAAYKAQYPISRTIFGFQTLRLVEVDADTLTFCFTADVPPFRKRTALWVRQWVDHGLVLSFAILKKR
ncbi:MAG: 4'-phosphopantetheinyl transferase superfamily protein [Alphaproteobacteria bacterium]|nr:4'-phosphopantetheinyl transferase superfamily protein [Alphaproteobacteria bacterium]